jgi:hypothetical protein
MNRYDFLTRKDLTETPQLCYVDGYKYQSRCDRVYYIGITGHTIVTDLITLRPDGWMLVSEYFAWDGCSGPAIDTKSNMRGGQCHDALAALMRMGLIPIDCVKPSNQAITRLMIDDGAWRFRANLYQRLLDLTEYWARPENSKKILVAP